MANSDLATDTIFGIYQILSAPKKTTRATGGISFVEIGPMEFNID